MRFALPLLLLASLLPMMAPAAPTGPDAPAMTRLPPHPRLLLEPGWRERVTAARRAQAGLDALGVVLESEGERLLVAPAVEYEKRGRRLLHASRQALRRIVLLGHLALTTDDARYAAAAEAQMRRLAAWPDWNPSHFLDTAEMAAALAIGYDWLFDRLAPETREAVRRALVEKALRPALDPALRSHTWFWRAENNWNQVCIGGLALAALAIGDEEPALCREILERARAGIVHSQPAYAPDGVYPEGGSYWSYGTIYQVLLIAALRTALGTDWGLTASPGFLASADFMVHATGPSGRLFNFADGDEGRGISPALFWFARERSEPWLVWHDGSRLEALRGGGAGVRLDGSEGTRFLPLLLHWAAASGHPASGAAPGATSWVGRGENPVAFHRTAWEEAAAWLAVKGGRGSVNHGHLDAGSFVYEAGGVRWAIDLGKQDYESLESKGIALWGREQDSERWTVHRLNNRFHNTLTIDDRLHVVDAAAPIVEHEAGGSGCRTVVDLTRTLGGGVTKALRTFRMAADGSVTVEDGIEGLAPGAVVRWAMHTRATGEAAGAVVALVQDGRRLAVERIEPAGAAWVVAPLPDPGDGFNAPNPGVSRLSLEVRAPESGGVRISVRLRAP